jgi:hypothetical protein
MAAPVETKVKAATGGASIGGLLAGLVILLLKKYVFNGTIDPVLEGEIYIAAPAVLAGLPAFLAGYRAKHTPRAPSQPTAQQMQWVKDYIATNYAPSPQGPVQVTPGQTVQVGGGGEYSPEPPLAAAPLPTPPQPMQVTPPQT